MGRAVVVCFAEVMWHLLGSRVAVYWQLDYGVTTTPKWAARLKDDDHKHDQGDDGVTTALKWAARLKVVQAAILEVQAEGNNRPEMGGTIEGR